MMEKILKCFRCFVPENQKKSFFLDKSNTITISNTPTIIHDNYITNTSNLQNILYSSSNSSNSSLSSKDIIETVKPKKIYRKKNIPSTVKRLVWNTYIGEDIGKSKCLCCKTTYITQLSFHCGHIISEKNGGEINVTNLKPICQNCNSSMGTTNMDDFMKKLE